MSSKPSQFTITSVKRAFAAAKLAGVEVGRVDIDRSGTISIFPAKVTQDDQPSNEWDKALGAPSDKVRSLVS
jgi:hypothetical protein